LGYYSVALGEAEFGRTVSYPPLDNHHGEPDFADIVDELAVGLGLAVGLASPL
jgi:hypothetical protein